LRRNGPRRAGRARAAVEPMRRGRRPIRMQSSAKLVIAPAAVARTVVQTGAAMQGARMGELVFGIKIGPGTRPNPKVRSMHPRH
jgi:hypothetical protein